MSIKIRQRFRTLFCPVNSAGCLNTCPPPPPPQRDLMVIFHEDLSYSYMINQDGSQRADVQITTPDGNADYATASQAAIVAGKLHLFGGWSNDNRKILRLDDCATVVLAARLINTYDYGHSALAIDNGQKALICYGNVPPYNYCDVFDGTTVAYAHSSAYSHTGSNNLGYYNGNPTSVGSAISSGYYKVETFDYEDGWRSLPDHPEDTRLHSLVGLPNGDMLLIGGQLGDSDTQKSSIWKLSVQGEWSNIGNLQLGVAWGSLILEGNSIYSHGGRDTEGPRVSSVQRIDLTEDGAIEEVEVILDDATFFYYPFLLLTDTSNSCVV